MGDSRENLIPFNQRAESEQREIQSAGGKASGRSRRQRASMREALNAVLAAPVKDKALKQELKESGAVELNANSLLALRLYQQALSGDTRAARLVLQAIGESDPAALEIANARIDLEYLHLEAVHPPVEPESDNSILTAIQASVDEVWDDYEQNDQQEGNDDV